MQITKLQDTYTIVVVATIKAPYYIQASWMRDLDILNSDEWTHVQNVIVVPDTSRFNIGDSITFYCDKTRIQIGTNDSTKVARIQSIAEGIIASMDIPDNQFKAVGINNEYIFTFQSKEDSVRFGDTFVPLNKWNGMFTTPRVLEFSIMEGSAVNNLEAKKTLKISSIGVHENTSIPIVNANSNYHYNIGSRDEALQVVSSATVNFDEFCRTFTNFVNTIE